MASITYTVRTTIDDDCIVANEVFNSYDKAVAECQADWAKCADDYNLKADDSDRNPLVFIADENDSTVSYATTMEGSIRYEIYPTPITAINPKYQSMVKRFVKWDKKYNAIVDFNHANDLDESNCPKQERAYEKAAEIFHDLPKREQANINKTITGY